MKRQIKVAFLFLVANLIPVIDAKYHVYGDRNHRAIAGFSLGGLQALASGLSHTELFSRVASFSAAIWAAANPGEGGGVDFEKVLADSAHSKSCPLPFMCFGMTLEMVGQALINSPLNPLIFIGRSIFSVRARPYGVGSDRLQNDRRERTEMEHSRRFPCQQEPLD